MDKIGELGLIRYYDNASIPGGTLQMSNKASSRFRLSRADAKALLLIGFFIATSFLTWRRFGLWGAMALLVSASLLFVAIQTCQQMARKNTRSAFLSMVALSAAAVTCWFLLIGAITPIADLVASIVGLAVAARLTLGSWTPFLHRRPLSKDVSLLRAMLVFAAVSWLALIPFETMTDAAYRPIVGSSKTAALSQSTNSGPRIALALSGGGYRAALFHAGVISELAYHRIPVDVVSSVSGGSIVASALFKCIPPSHFVDAVADGQLNLTRALASPRHVIPALWAVLRGPEREFSQYTGKDDESASLVTASRTFLQANLVARAFVAGTDCNLWNASMSPIEWLVGLTDIRGINLVGASPTGTWIVPIRPHAASVNSHNLRGPYGDPQFLKCSLHDFPLIRRRIVAASGAFPGAFEPLVVWQLCEEANLGAKNELLRLHLADGGIADNSGVALLDVAFAGQQTRNVAIILASNGSSIARSLGVSPISEPHGDLFGTSGNALAGLGSTIDILHSFSGARFRPRTGENARLIEIAPSSLFSTREPGELSALFLLDGRKALARFANMTEEDIDRAAQLLAANESQNRHFAHVIRECIAKKNRGGDFCLSEGKPTKYYHETVAGRIDALLRSFESADTLQARFSRKQADAMFRLGQFVMLTQRAGVESAYRAAGEAHQYVDTARVSPVRN